MKKLTALLISLTLVLSLTGCSTLDKIKEIELPPLPTSQPEQTAVPEAPAVTEAPAPVVETQSEPSYVVVGITGSTNEFFDPQNGTVKILTFSYDTPSVYIENNVEASDTINEYIARIDETYITGNDYGVGTADGMNLMLEMAQDNYYVAVQNNVELPMEFASDMSVRTERLDDRCIDLVYTNYSYTGGAHGNYGDMAYVFDGSTGEKLTFDMLSRDAYALRSFLTEYMMKLAAEDKDGYYSQRINDEYLADGKLETSLSALLRDGSWYFDNDGMCVFSSVYEIAPYSAGIIEFHIPYAELSAHIDARFMPREKTQGGNLSLRLQSDISDGSVEVIDRVAVDEVGTELAVVAVGTLYQVKLSKVSYANEFYETDRLWACSEMTDCALQIVTDIPDAVPNLMLTFIDGGNYTHELLITQSGDDGSLILLDKNSIQAQG